MDKRSPLAPLFAVLFALVPARAWAQPISEFPLPAGTPVTGSVFVNYAHTMTSGPDGNLWLSDMSRSSIIRMTPIGEVTEFKVSAFGITAGPDGNLWFTSGGQIGRMSPDGGTLAWFPLQIGVYPVGIVSGPDGNLWFTEYGHGFVLNGVLPWPTAIGKVTPGGTMTEYPGEQAAGIIIGPDRNLWFTSNPLERATLQGALSHITTNPSINPPVAITLGPDGNVWFAAPTDDVFNDVVGYVGKITPAGAATPYALPMSHAYPVDIISGPDGNLWFTEMKANKIGRITPQGVITEFPVPTPDAGPAAICVGPDGNIWFTESNAAKVGRLALSGPAAGNITLTVPAAASSAGANGTFFHSDLWLMNRSFTSPVVTTLTYRCTSGFACGNAVQAVTLPARQSVMLIDVIGRTFSAPSTSGAIEISWPTTSGPVSASSQVSSPLPPAPAFGTLVPALPPSAAKMHAVFIGVESGGDLTSGSRSNAGAYNPQPVPVDVTFALHKGDGTELGTYSRTYQPNEAYQLFPNVFDLLGAGSTVATDAYLVVTATAPVFPYVTVIDNVSGDSSFLCASDDETAP
jgi:streptogramin lyase